MGKPRLYQTGLLVYMNFYCKKNDKTFDYSFGFFMYIEDLR